MRGKKVKAIRKDFYGDMSPRVRRYFMKQDTGQVIADPARRAYQRLKKEARHGG